MAPLFSSVMRMLLGLVLGVISSVLLDSSLIDLASLVIDNIIISIFFFFLGFVFGRICRLIFGLFWVSILDF